MVFLEWEGEEGESVGLGRDKGGNYDLGVK